MNVCPKCQSVLPDGATACTACAPAPPSARPLRLGWKSILLVLCALIAAILVPAVQQAREAARRTSCNCNLKQLGLALHNYHDKYGSLPPAYVADAQGRPLHSWRVLLLPFLDQAELYAEYRFDEPWDSPHNLTLLDRIPPVYKCPTHAPAARRIAGGTRGFSLLACSGPETVATSVRPRCTNYAAVLGPDAAFTGATPVSLDEITDGISVTLLIGEVTDADILWTQPVDIDITKHPQIGDRQGFSSDHTAVVHFVHADGSVARLSDKSPQAVVDALFTRAGGETIARDY